MERKSKVDIVKDLVNGKPISHDGVVIERDGAFNGSILGTDFSLSPDEFRKRFSGQAVIIIPDNNRD